MGMPKGKGLVAVIAATVVALAIGIGIGVGIRESIGFKKSELSETGTIKQPPVKPTTQPAKTQPPVHDEVADEKERFKHHKTIVEELKADNIRKTLEYMTRDPNNAGTKVAKEQAEYVAKTWKDQGFDDVKIHMYDIVLSFPLSPGHFTIMDKNGTKIHSSGEILEKPIVAGENDSRVLYPFNAYSAAGTVEGELVYANYGRDSDFDYLASIGINVTGKIILTRYGKTSRSSKVKRAQLRRAAGMIIYSDPEDWAPRGNKFPDGWELPDTGIQRGTISRRQGDALSPEYPSKEGMFRLPVSNLSKTHFPTIPSQPISAAQATPLLRMMDGTHAKGDFWGTIPGVTYRYNSTRRVKLTVNTTLESKRTYTVSAVMYGDKEPDRLVLLGNHRDSWVYGAADATSGQAALLEISRVLGEWKKNKKWRPRRSIMLCSWDAEEYGIMASTEWVTDHSKMLQERAVAYLNIDIAVEGNYSIRLRSTPVLDEAFFDATKLLKSPNNAKTLYDDWLYRLPGTSNTPGNKPGEPKIQFVTSGSDYKPFWQQIGIPCTDHRYMFDKTVKPYPYMYPVYHSVHDNFFWVSKFLDPDFRYHLSVGQMWAMLALRLADSNVIPYNLKRGAEVIKYFADKFKKDHQAAYLDAQGIKSERLVQAAANLTKAATAFHESLAKLDKNDPLKVRMANDKMMYFHRSFIHDTGVLPGKGITSRHTIYSSTSWFLKSGNKFAGVLEAIYRAVKKWEGSWDDVRRQLTLVVYHMQQATRSLEMK